MGTNDSKSQAIARRIRLAREIAGLSQAQVASALGLHRPSISEIEAGRRRVGADELVALAEILEVSLGWLAGETSLTVNLDDDRIELAARELSKLDPRDLDRVLHILAAIRKDDP